ncbi:SGNH/GDSL hydrolase family protein [Winogradskyella flava]|uniref:G-D-S-L family lipolytic protein n=1 Tax=Winogradskyella flava TaxID=1884876 RepID=A0A842INU2_9FLAO|nr:G-D-S-L family lipolytic protein [Winogradskyella flava]MBC2843566.1 G-D-S-L family lipolytic protein [Winogradskyella flava]
MKQLKYIVLSLLTLGMMACENELVDDLRDRNNPPTDPLPDLTAGSADFSNYVSIGPSFTAGFTDNGLFIASQENSFPNILAGKFANAGGGSFTQPWMSDNFGGLAAGGTRITDPRLVFGGAGPVPLESVIGPVTVGTDIVLNNPSGPFNNLGIPGAKSFHFIAPGYGNFANFPAAANPYAVRVTGNTPNATILELATDQNPSFFTADLIGGNDVLGYATAGGDANINQITDPAIFEGAFNAIIAGLTANGAKGAVTNIPYVSSLPYFNAVPFDALDPTNPAFGPLIPTLNGIFGQINLVYQALGQPERSIVFSETAASPVVIRDESLADVSAQMIAAFNASPTFPLFVQSLGLPAAAAPLVANLLGATYGQTRQANSEDLLTLPSASVIGTVNSDFFAFLTGSGIPAALAGQFAVEGITYPLDDRWVLLPSENAEIVAAVDAYNATISSVASTNGLALVDVNAILTEASTTGIMFDDYNMNTDLVFGGLVSLDGVHLTARGYALMANSFLQAIDSTYGSNFEASGNLARAGDFPTNFSPLLQ